MYTRMEQSCMTDRDRMRECSVCQLSGSSELFRKCCFCQAVLYCSKTCQEKDWLLEGPLAAHSHKYWCEKMKAYMGKADQLRMFPFTFTGGICTEMKQWNEDGKSIIVPSVKRPNMMPQELETTSDTFTGVKYKQFLEKNGVFQQGGWLRECQLHNHRNCACLIPFGELPETDDVIVLPVESCVLDDKPSGPADNVTCWELYYSWRGFKMDSPVAVLLHWPLTVFYIVKYCLPTDYADNWEGGEYGNLSVDIVGVEREVELLPIFVELGFLFPSYTVNIKMYGNTISKKVNGKVLQKNNVRIEVTRGLYHKKASSCSKPNVVIGFNAGLGAYQHWSQTLVKLQTQKCAAYFTDYCQYSCAYARSHVEGLGLGTTSEPVINPFRKPVRTLSTETDLPRYSNGFIYHLIYTK